MARKEQKQSEGRSLLWAAQKALERGDVVQARAIAGEVLAGKRGADDEKAAVELSKLLSAEGAAVAETVDAVAQELKSRSNVPPRTYLFAGIAALALTLLAVLAAVRY